MIAATLVAGPLDGMTTIILEERDEIQIAIDQPTLAKLITGDMTPAQWRSRGPLSVADTTHVVVYSRDSTPVDSADELDDDAADDGEDFDEDDEEDDEGSGPTRIQYIYTRTDTLEAPSPEEQQVVPEPEEEPEEEV